MSGFWTCHECGAEMYGFENCQFCGAHKGGGEAMSELKSLSKLKKAGRLHYWRGTIEIDERELHTICDEIQAEYDKAVAAMNKAAGNWAKADAELRGDV